MGKMAQSAGQSHAALLAPSREKEKILTPVQTFIDNRKTTMTC
jgi:hypothetical protein